MRSTSRRLNLAALIASITLTSAGSAFGQEIPTVLQSTYGPAGVIVSLRTQLPTTPAPATQVTGSEKQEAVMGDSVDPTAPKDGTGKDEEVKSATGSSAAPASEAGRLSPIIMESVRTPIGAANISATEVGTKILPEDQAAKQALGTVPLPTGIDRSMSGLTYRWQAANICHLPLYFEEPMLERHGQQRCPTIIQPVVSGGKFLGNLLLYPYKATLHPAFENRYTLGHFRPGSGAPALRDTLPWSVDAALVEAGAATAVFVGLPW